MNRYNISAYVDETMSWGEPTQRAVLSIDEAPNGKWVKADDFIKSEHHYRTEISELRAQLDRANAMILRFMESAK